ncbi:hypothetical protein HK102_007585, partial [Quaeritorhiza haematococci]
MSTTSVKVALRVRPLTAKELLSEARECIAFVPGVPQVILGSIGNVMVNGQPAQQRSFTFDYVFDTESNQHQVYDDCVSTLVDRFVEGFNATILAYGQTGSGKTYSMGTGVENGSLDDQNQ